MDKLIVAMMEAPDWLRVRSVTVETAEETTILTREDLTDYTFPLVAFTMCVEVLPARNE